VQLVHKLPHFTYDPSRCFRGWLKTLAYHAWRDYLGRRRRPGLGSGDADIRQQLDSVASRHDLEKELQTALDREVLEKAMTRVRQRVAAHTWEAFWLLTFERLDGAEVASRVGMRVSMVYVARCKVQKMLRQEVDKLEGEAAA
jgi:DNA-directed RNA polymerase specialized sigma24 family protein